MQKAYTKFVKLLDKHPGPINLLQAFATLAAVLVALFLPGCLQDKKDLKDLVAYQNLAYFSARLVEHTMEEAQQGRWLRKDNSDYPAVTIGLNAIRLNEINPPSLIVDFVEIVHMTQRASQMVANQNSNPALIEETLNRTRNAMAAIDKYLKDKGVTFDKVEKDKALPP